jgi:uncharacterized protein
MYLERSIDAELLTWKESAKRKPLLIRGARQVGKSTAVRHLSKTFELLKSILMNKHRIKFYLIKPQI